MPLDTPQKLAHILTVTNRSFKGRQRKVTFVYLASGVYSFVAISVIFRFEQIIDPQIHDPAGNLPPQIYDAQIVAPLGTNFVGVVYIADTPTATQAAVAAANKYELIEALPVGIVPGGSHLRALLRRLR